MLFLEFFLYAGVISANFRFFGKFVRSMELLTEPKRKGASISKFYLIVFVGKSDFWVALLVSKFYNPLLISLIDWFLNENLFNNAYGFDKEALSLIYSYLRNRKHSLSINNAYSTFWELISGVPQGSVLGALLLNIFLNDLNIFITKTSLHNNADDNTLSA